MLQTVTTVIGDLYGCLLEDEPEVPALDALCWPWVHRHSD